MRNLRLKNNIDFIDSLKNRNLIDFDFIIENSFEGRIEESILRDSVNSLGFYFLVTERLVNNVYELLKNKKCLEIMSGTGFFAKCLADKGLDIIATDSKEWNLNDQGNVLKIDAIEAVEHYKETMDLLIICWPYMDNIAYQAIKSWGSEKPILVCAELGGCCADEMFSAAFKCEFLEVGHQNFSYIRDHFYIGNYVQINEEDYYNK